MSRDPLDERCAALFAAGRREEAPEATRERIALALRTRVAHAVPSDARFWRRPVARAALAAAAAALLLFGTFRLVQLDAEPVPISAEEPRAPAAKERAAGNRALAPVEEPAPSAEAPRAPRPELKREPATLEEELASMQRARTALGRGNALAALAELERFGRRPGWRQLAVEASLLRIEALARAGRAAEAQNLARRFVAEHPNNPLVDRARTFAGTSSPSRAGSPSQETHDE